MYLDVCRTQRLKSPGVPHRILAAPLPEAQYLFSRLVPLLFLAIGSPPRKLGRYAPRGVRAEERDTPSLNQRRTELYYPPYRGEPEGSPIYREAFRASL